MVSKCVTHPKAESFYGGKTRQMQKWKLASKLYGNSIGTAEKLATCDNIYEHINHQWMHCKWTVIKHKRCNPTTTLDLVCPDTREQSRGSSLCCRSARSCKWLTRPAGLRRAERQRCAYTGRVSLSSDMQQSWRTLTQSQHAAVWAWCIAVTKPFISRHGKWSKPS